MKSHSQFGEDAWLILNPPFELEFGTFCEIGAFDGIQSSNTLLFEELFGWKGLCVEPNPEQWLKCRGNRRSVSVCLGVGMAIGNREFFIPAEDNGQAGYRVKGCPYPIMTACTTLESVWTAFFQSEQPTLVSIDTEGTELEVWESRGSLTPLIVIIEYLSGDMVDRSKQILERFSIDGYKQVHRTEANLIFVKE